MEVTIPNIQFVFYIRYHIPRWLSILVNRWSVELTLLYDTNEIFLLLVMANLLHFFNRIQNLNKGGRRVISIAFSVLHWVVQGVKSLVPTVVFCSLAHVRLWMFASVSGKTLASMLRAVLRKFASLLSVGPTYWSFNTCCSEDEGSTFFRNVCNYLHHYTMWQYLECRNKIVTASKTTSFVTFTCD